MNMHERLTAPPAPPARAAHRRQVPVYRLVAGVLWLAGVSTTAMLIQALAGGMPYGYAWLAALPVQLVLTLLERPAWRGRANALSWSAVVLDTLINAGGLYQSIASRLGSTPPAAMLADAAGVAPGPLAAWAAMVVALLAGVILAYAPEEVWRWQTSSI